MNKNTFLYLLSKSCLLRPKSNFPIKEMISVTKQNVVNLENYSSNILMINYESSQFFFRECRKRYKTKQHIFLLINDFFERHSDFEKLKVLIQSELFNNRKFKKFLCMGLKNDVNSNISQYIKSGNPSILGLNIELEDNQKRVFKEFVFFMCNEIAAYKLNSGVKIGLFQTYNASRSICTKLIADLLNLSYLVPKTIFVELKFEEKKCLGSLMERAPGQSVVKIPPDDRKRIVSAQLYHCLCNLNFLDSICYEKDHRPNNYLVELDDNGVATGVCAFDNDAPLTFFPSSNPSFSSYMGCSGIIARDGTINRPYMDISLATRISNISFKDVKKTCSNYLNSFQIRAIFKRISKLKKSIELTQKNRPSFLVEDADWNIEMLSEDLSGKYGKTYLSSFLNDCFYEKGFLDRDII